MKNAFYIFLVLFLTLVSRSQVHAQTPTDAIMMEEGQICFAALYTNDTWDEYWEGTLKRTNGNVGTLTRQTIMPMFALGITDRINVIATLPWVSTEASGGQMRGSSGFQDFGLWLKGTAYETAALKGIFSVHGALGMTLPSSDYLEDYGPFSLGLGCPDFSLRAILEQRMDKGFYVRGQAAYLIRGNAKIERDYYYTTHGVYSDEVDMPNAMSYGGTLGSWLFDNSLQVEATYDGLSTFGGYDIRRQDVGFPSNKMNFTRVGAFVHYYFKFAPGLGIIAQYNHVLTGRNVGQSSAYTGGISYQFGLWKKHEMAETTN